MNDDRINDHRIDELLADAARDYNAPANVPRDEIWSRIQAERTARRRAGSAPRLWVWPSVAVAAAALVAIGVTVGRRMERSAGTPRTLAPRVVAAAPRAVSDSSASTALSYRLVVLKHLAGSEAMITAFRSAARHGEIDAQIADWSKELLSTTRMLEASAANDDPTMRRLLEDLELVLAQIKQYVSRGTNNRDDLDLIEQSIIKRGVITKLRSTAPARNVPAGT
jgi:hypothetical protein